jgi:hypothetical protein
VALLNRVPISARVTGNMRTTVRLRMAYATRGSKMLPLPCYQQAKEKEHGEVDHLAPLLGEFHAVLASFLESNLHRQARNKRCDEHARADRLGGYGAERQQRYHTKLLRRGCPGLWSTAASRSTGGPTGCGCSSRLGGRCSWRR